MKLFTKTVTRRSLLASATVALMSCLLLGAIDLPQTPAARRATAQSRWAARPFSAYRIAFRVEYLNRVCFQEVEIQDEHVRKLINDTCSVSWFSSLTVARLFDISQRMEQAPACYSDSRPCACRLMRVGSVGYDAQLGYPREIDYRRTVQPNWWHADFWKRLWDRKQLPNCGQERTMRIVVSSFTPLP